MAWAIKYGVQITSLWILAVAMLPEHLITGPSHYNLQGSARMHKNSMKQGGNSNQMQPSRGKKTLAKCLFALISGLYKAIVSMSSERIISRPASLSVDQSQEVEEVEVRRQLLATVVTQGTEKIIVKWSHITVGRFVEGWWCYKLQSMLHLSLYCCKKKKKKESAAGLLKEVKTANISLSTWPANKV